MRRYLAIFILIILIIELCGCRNTNSYVDIDGLQNQNIFIDGSEVVADTEKSDIRKSVEYLSDVTSNGKLILENDRIINIETGYVDYNCSLTGCNHLVDSCESAKYKKYSDILYLNDELVYVYDNIIGIEKNGKDEVVLINNQYTNQSKEINPDKPSTLGNMIAINEYEIVVMGINYIFLFDLENKKQQEIIEVGDNALLYAAVVDESNIVVVNQDSEMYIVDLNNRNVIKLEDHVVYATTNNNYIYYVYFIDGLRYLYKCDITGDRKELILEDVGYHFVPYNDKSYVYTIIGDYEHVYKYEAETDKVSVIVDITKNNKGASIGIIDYFEESGQMLIVVDYINNGKYEKSYIIYNLNNWKSIWINRDTLFSEINNSDYSKNDNTNIFMSTINLFKLTSNGNYSQVGDSKLEADDEGINLELFLNYDTNVMETEIPVDIYAVTSDGEFLEIGDGCENFGYCISEFIKMKQDNFIPITIMSPKNKTVYNETYVNIIVNFNPSYLNDDGIEHEFSSLSMISFCMRLSSEVDGENNNIYIPKDSELLDLDFKGRVVIRDDKFEMAEDINIENLYDTPICLKKNDEKIYLCVGIGEGVKDKCFVLLFVDGKIVDIFDNNKLAFLNEKDVFLYGFNPCDYINGEKKHTVQAYIFSINGKYEIASNKRMFEIKY